MGEQQIYKHEVEETKDIDLDHIKYDPNIRSEFDEGYIKELSESLVKYGQLQSICVYTKDSDFHVIYGKSRCLAAIKAGFKTIRADIASEPESDLDRIYLQAIENEQNSSLTPADRENYIHSLIEKEESFEKIADTIGKSESWVRACEAAYKIRNKYKGLIDKAKLTLSTKDLYALRNASQEQVKEAIMLSKKEPEKLKEILKDLNIRTKKKLNVGGKRKRENETTALAGKIVLEILIDEETKNIQINTRKNKKVDEVLFTSLYDVVCEFFNDKKYQTLMDSTGWNHQDENEEKTND
jgi:ParB family chromosome partitioning protein